MMISLRTLVFSVFVTTALAATVGASAAPVALDPAKLKLQSANVLVLDPSTDQPIFAKSANTVTPIASITKLMTAMVVLDSNPNLDEVIAIDADDLDFVKGTRSRLHMGTELSRRELLRLALMSSENRAASALARSYAGGNAAFIAAMNAKARALGMTHTHFDDATGLTPTNVSTANELAIMVQAAANYPLIREFTTTPSHYVEVQPTGRVLGFNNSNRLVSSGAWDIQLQKTGFINEAGRCLVMMAQVASRPVVIVLLDSVGKYSRLGDANRVKYWLETGNSMPAAKAAAPSRKPATKKVYKAKFAPRYASAATTRSN